MRGDIIKSGGASTGLAGHSTAGICCIGPVAQALQPCDHVLCPRHELSLLKVRKNEGMKERKKEDRT